MAPKADIGGKRLISLAPTAWVQWVTQQPDLVAQEILGSEFQWISRETDRQIMRWDMAVLRESPWYQEILREGERRGEQRGEQRGREAGRQEGQQSLILRQLTRRVGDLPPELVTQVQALDLEQLEALAEALLDFTALPDLENWLAALPNGQSQE